MTDYLSPGVYVEETGQPHSIQGLPTSTAGFVGPTHSGPLVLASAPLTGLAEFEQRYGGPQLVQFEDASPMPNFMWHAARAFFENGGTRLYVSRVFAPGARSNSDGRHPTAADYAGIFDSATNRKTALMAFEDVDEISAVAAPGVTFGFEDNSADARSILNLLIAHVEQMRYRIAVLDSGDGQGPDAVQAFRANFNSRYAALYYPWVTVHDPSTGASLNLPPSGFITGIYARTDLTRGVSKSPANEVINLAIGLETILDDTQQRILNPLGINTLRFFPGRGYLVWGARTISSDSEWKYVAIRRYLAYLEHSIDNGTQWVVFEPSGEPLWANVRQTISVFLSNEWRNGALIGSKPDEAYFVKCDRSTMTQNDIDNGRLIVLIGVAALRPAEFVIFRIDRWTADHKS
jgi:phage tail sheath protein FI